MLYAHVSCCPPICFIFDPRFVQILTHSQLLLIVHSVAKKDIGMTSLWPLSCPGIHTIRSTPTGHPKTKAEIQNMTVATDSSCFGCIVQLASCLCRTPQASSTSNSPSRNLYRYTRTGLRQPDTNDFLSLSCFPLLQHSLNMQVWLEHFSRPLHVHHVPGDVSSLSC